MGRAGCRHVGIGGIFFSLRIRRTDNEWNRLARPQGQVRLSLPLQVSHRGKTYCEHCHRCYLCVCLSVPFMMAGEISNYLSSTLETTSGASEVSSPLISCTPILQTGKSRLGIKCCSEG